MSRANDATSVRMHPWVSYGLGLLLVLGSVGLFVASPSERDSVGESVEMKAAFRHFERNPEVKVNARLAQFIGAEYMAEVRARHEVRRKAGSIAVLSQRMRDKTQKRFDEIQRKAFASLHELPSWHLGIIDSGTPLQNTFTHLVVNDTAIAIGVSAIAIGIAALMLEAAWGSLLLAGLCLLLPMVTRVTYTTLYGDQGIPWIGASGLAAGLLGAHLIRSFGGLTIPAWFVLPVWVVAEYLFARDMPMDQFDAAPLVVHATCFGFGALTAAGVQVLGLDGKHAERKADSPNLVSNPVLERALAESDAGNHDAAFDLLFDELKRSPGNHDAAVALWKLASGSSRVQPGSQAVLGSVRESLRRGRLEDACSLWNLMVAEVEPRAEATLLVRVGEALLSEEQHDAAIHAFSLAIRGKKPLSSVLALRVVRGTRDLDAELAAKGAAIALIDDQLALADRNAMQLVVDAVQTRSGAGAPVSLAAPEAQPSTPEVPELSEAPPASEQDPYQDPHALRADTFHELGEGESLAGDDPESWNQPGMVEDLSSELEDEEHAGFDWSGLQDDGGPAVDLPGVDTNVELDPGASDGGASDVGASDAGASDDGAAGVSPVGEDSSDASEITETTESLVETSGLDGDGGLGDEFETPRRSLVAREAMPVSIDDEVLEIEVEGGSKTRLPLSRIEAVATGAVHGLADKPVLILDLVLNWLDVPDEPLKVVRIRSDRFDPRTLVPGKDSALDALRAMLDTLVSHSGATPLPSRDNALGNPFATFADIDQYGREVLMVE